MAMGSVKAGSQYYPRQAFSYGYVSIGCTRCLAVHYMMLAERSVIFDSTYQCSHDQACLLKRSLFSVEVKICIHMHSYTSPRPSLPPRS